MYFLNMMYVYIMHIIIGIPLHRMDILWRKRNIMSPDITSNIVLYVNVSYKHLTFNFNSIDLKYV